MDFDFLGEVVSVEDAKILREKLVSRLTGSFFLDRVDSIPLACRIKPDEQDVDFDESWFSGRDEVIVYMENYEKMIRSNVAKTLLFLRGRESWQDYDVCIFDDELSWCAALTHNDEVKFLSFAVS